MLVIAASRRGKTLGLATTVVRQATSLPNARSRGLLEVMEADGHEAEAAMGWVVVRAGLVGHAGIVGVVMTRPIATTGERSVMSMVVRAGRPMTSAR